MLDVGWTTLKACRAYTGGGLMRRFSVVMRGYSRREVDDLFARIDVALGRGTQPATPATPADIRATVFRLRMRGYAPREVDKELTKALQELEAGET